MPGVSDSIRLWLRSRCPLTRSESLPSSPISAKAVQRTALGVLLFCTLVSAISRGVSESFAVFLLPITQEFNSDRAATTASYSIFMIALGVMSPIAGTIFDRLGARLCYSIGLLVMGSAYLIASQASALWHLYFSTGLGGAIGVAMVGMLPASSLVSRWFHKKLTTALGVISASLGTGLILFSPLIQWLIDHFGWRTSFQLLGSLLLAIMLGIQFLPWLNMTLGSPENIATHAQRTMQGVRWTLRQAAGTLVFWALFWVMFFTSVSTYAVTVQLVAYLVHCGLSPIQAATIYGVAGMASIAGIIVSSMLAEKMGELRVAIISYGLSIAGLVALALVSQTPSIAVIAVFILLFGTMQGSRGPLVAVLSTRNFAGGRQTGIYGSVLLGMGLGGALGSWGSGYLYDLTGGYLASFVFSAFGAICGMLIFVTVPALGGGLRRKPLPSMAHTDKGQ